MSLDCEVVMETLGLDAGECGFGYGGGHGKGSSLPGGKVGVFNFEADWDILGHAPACLSGALGPGY